MMKKLFCFFAFALCAALISCDDEESGSMEWDLYPWNVEIAVNNAGMEDLLDPGVAGHIPNENITLTYKGKEYRLNSDAPETRAYLPQWNGISKINTGGRYYLQMGEFGPDFDRDETMILDWGDSTQDVIRVVFTVKYGKKDVDVSGRLYINGTQVKNPAENGLTLRGTIVKSLQ